MKVKQIVMKVEDFAVKNSFKQRDLIIVSKVYSGQERTETEWFEELKDKIDFNHSKYLNLEKVEENKKNLKK